MDKFDSIWDKLAAYGQCDERGGAEYRRVRELWECSFSFTAIMATILIHANEGPTEQKATLTEDPNYAGAEDSFGNFVLAVERMRLVQEGESLHFLDARSEELREAEREVDEHVKRWKAEWQMDDDDDDDDDANET